MLETVGRQSARETWESGSKSVFESAAELADETPAAAPTEMGAFANEMSALEAESAVENARESRVAEIPSHEIAPGDSSGHSEIPAGELPPHEVAEERNIGYVNGESSGTEQIVEDLIEAPAEVAASDVARASEAVVADQQVPEPVAQHAIQEEAVHLEPVHAEEKTPEPEPAAINSWFSRPASPWDTDVQRSSLTSTWDTANPSSVAVTHESAPETEVGVEAHAANGQSSQEEVATVIADERASQTAATADEKPAAVDMDALVAKVLARMSPDVMQTLTRELLKPMVAALVEDELKNKK